MRGPGDVTDVVVAGHLNPANDRKIDDRNYRAFCPEAAIISEERAGRTDEGTNERTPPNGIVTAIVTLVVNSRSANGR